jgi:hypothetical protein
MEMETSEFPGLWMNRHGACRKHPLPTPLSVGSAVLSFEGVWQMNLPPAAVEIAQVAPADFPRMVAQRFLGGLRQHSDAIPFPLRFMFFGHNYRTMISARSC